MEDQHGDHHQSALPPGLDVLWGRRRRGQRGPRPGLSVEAIVEAATGVAAEEGLGAVSMARVAKELGFTTMSLYRHVDSKEEMLALMWNASAIGARDVVLEGDDWRSLLTSWVTQQRAVLDQNTWILQMPIGAPPMAPNSLLWVEKGLAALEGSGLTDAEKLGVIGLLTSYTLNEARMAFDAARERDAAREQGRAAPDFADVVRQVADADTYPVLHRIAWSGEVDPSDVEAEWAAFEFGLERILDGAEKLIESRRTRPHD